MYKNAKNSRKIAVQCARISHYFFSIYASSGSAGLFALLWWWLTFTFSCETKGQLYFLFFWLTEQGVG